MFRVCWSLSIEWNGADNNHLIEVLYLTNEQYEKFKKDLETEESSEEVLVGKLPKEVHENNQDFKFQVEKAFDRWNGKKYGKKPFSKLVEVNSTYNIINDWDLTDDLSDYDRAGCEVFHHFNVETPC